MVIAVSPNAAEAVLQTAHAELVEDGLRQAQERPEDIDLVGFHGQTVVHVPPSGEVQGQTLQIGDGQALSERLGIPVVYDAHNVEADRFRKMNKPLVSLLVRWMES